MGILPYSSLALLAGIGLTICGCAKRDHEVEISRPLAPIAVGAYYRLSAFDACAGGGKGNFCGTETLTKLEQVSVSDQGILQARSRDQLPAELQVPGVDWALQGVAPGRAQVQIRATFSDGSLRSGEMSVDVSAVSHVEAEVGCAVADPEDRTLFPPGQRVHVAVQLFGGETKLLGLVQEALFGPGLTQVVGLLQQTEYTWTASDSPGTVVDIGSMVAPGVSLSLRVFSLDALKIDKLESRFSAPLRFLRADPTVLQATMTVDGKRPCYDLPVDAITLSPEICLGPNREAEWTEARAAVRILPLQSGTCRLSVAVPGTADRREFDVTYEVFDR